ncbi:WD40 repeat-like protein [Favolaschia claudopus]|uniref:WD40 repeat-like protein n=1 Tax=Favolaschia claudopus TaxID=2862362 RepID=A0AAV9ZXN1_9AGAR
MALTILGASFIVSLSRFHSVENLVEAHLARFRKIAKSLCQGVWWQSSHLSNTLVKGNIKPTWNESFDLTSPSSSTLTFRLFHDAPGPDVRIAEAEISVGELRQCLPNEAGVVRIKLQAAKEVLGRLCVSVRAITGDKAIEQMSEEASRLELRPLVGDTLLCVAAVEGLNSGVKLSGALSGIHPYANVAWKVLTSVYKIVQNQREADEKVVKLVEAISRLYSFAKDVDTVVNKSKPVEETILRITMQTMECALLIREHLGHGFVGTFEPGRIAQTSILGAGQRIDQMAAELLRLEDEFDRGLASKQPLSLLRLWAKSSNWVQITILFRDFVLFAKRSVKIPVFWMISEAPVTFPAPKPKSSGFLAWLDRARPPSQPVYLSTFAGLVVSGHSSASHAMTWLEVIRSSCFTLLHMAHPHIERAICMALSRDINLKAPLENQFLELLFGPLESVKEHLIGPFIIVIDALDECADHSLDILSKLIVNFFTKLPAAVRFFVISRPDIDIARVFRHQAAVQERTLDITAAEHNDISMYIRDRLTTIRQQHGLSHTWPEENIVRQLIDLSGNLFIWAATALDFVGGKKSFQPRTSTRLENLLQTPFKTGNLDQLYTLALASDGDWQDQEFKGPATAVLAAIVFAQSPMTDSMMDAILGFDNGTAARVLEFLGSVIQWSAGQPARTLHASFADFLVGSQRVNEPWFFDVSMAKKSLASGCFMVLQKHLKFNICQSPDSHLLNSEVPGLIETAKSQLSPALKYASRRFLFWLEVLSILQEVVFAVQILEIAQMYVLVRGGCYTGRRIQ